MTRLRALLGCVAVMAAVIGCSSGGSGPTSKSTGNGPKVTSSMPYDQALAQVHDYALKSLQAFPTGASLTFREDNSVPCSNDDNAPSSTPVNIGSYYWLAGISPSDNAKYVDDFVNFWKQQGWKVVRDDRPGDQFVSVGEPSGFSVIIQVTPDGSKVSITGSSPCVAPKTS
jgi:hypothetical protein